MRSNTILLTTVSRLPSHGRFYVKISYRVLNKGQRLWATAFIFGRYHSRLAAVVPNKRNWSWMDDQWYYIIVNFKKELMEELSLNHLHPPVLPLDMIWFIMAKWESFSVFRIKIALQIYVFVVGQLAVSSTVTGEKMEWYFSTWNLIFIYVRKIYCLRCIWTEIPLIWV